MDKHELNNEGCKCRMCQKLCFIDNMKVNRHEVKDEYSEAYDHVSQELYIKVIHKLEKLDAKTRKIRFALPEICLYDNINPIELISKRCESSQLKIISEKSKLHMFEIIQFFLEGFVSHNREKKIKKRSTSFALQNHSEKLKNECIVVAKYQNNFYKLMTPTQMQGLFKSSQKMLRNQLMYLQTIVGTKDFEEKRVNIKLRDLVKSSRYERAKNEAKIIHEEVKNSDMEFVSEEDEILYENELKEKSMKEFLEYLSLKIIFVISRFENTIISESIFKFINFKAKVYLFDIRMIKEESCEFFWATAALKAFEFKLARRMSMIDFDKSGSQIILEEEQASIRYRGEKSKNLAEWLERSTSMEMGEMNVIKRRLEKMEKEKSFLLESRSVMEKLNMNERKFKVRSLYKR